MLLSIESIPVKKIHFAGIFGSGMSAIAQFLRWQDITVTGSDRSVNNKATKSTQSKLEQIGCRVFDQDGSGITDDTDILCVSSAIEDDNPDLSSANKFGVRVVHRSDVLAAIVKQYKTIAVAGTSGKSTVTAMIFEFLSHCGKSPSLITGAPIIRLEEQGYIGNAFSGTSDLLVIEADESDGSCVKYSPYLSLFLNVSKDHKTVDEVIGFFKQLNVQSDISISNADDALLSQVNTTKTFSLSSTSDWRPSHISQGKTSCTLIHDSAVFELPIPGLHNLSNCAGALAVSEHFGCSQECLKEATAMYRGVARRFTIHTCGNNIIVVDDFAHNPAKIEAAVSAARSLAPRIIALYQPHGFGPTRFLRHEYRNLFRNIFREGDVLYLLPIYYAGGTAINDISSADLMNDIGEVPFTVVAPDHRDLVPDSINKTVKTGNVILCMGARDPSLPLFVQSIIDTIR